MYLALFLALLLMKIVEVLSDFAAWPRTPTMGLQNSLWKMEWEDVTLLKKNEIYVYFFSMMHIFHTLFEVFLYVQIVSCHSSKVDL